MKMQGNLVRTWRRHDFETLSSFLVPCGGNPPVTAGFPNKEPMRSFGLFLLLVWASDYKQWNCRWFSDATAMWRYCNDVLLYAGSYIVQVLVISRSFDYYNSNSNLFLTQQVLSDLCIIMNHYKKIDKCVLKYHCFIEFINKTQK